MAAICHIAHAISRSKNYVSEASGAKRDAPTYKVGGNKEATNNNNNNIAKQKIPRKMKR